MTFEEKAEIVISQLREDRDRLQESLSRCIEIPDGATNGDIIMAMFPNCEQKEHIHNGYFEMYFDGEFGNASYMRISKDWWNAPYNPPKQNLAPADKSGLEYADQPTLQSAT